MRDTVFPAQQWHSWWNRFPAIMERYRAFVQAWIVQYTPKTVPGPSAAMLEFLESIDFKIQLQPVGVNAYIGKIQLPNGSHITNKKAMPYDLAQMGAVEYCLAWQFDHESKS